MYKKERKLHPGDTFAIKEPTPIPSSNVSLKKAKNGYVVSSFKDGQECLYIAKSHAEAQKYASKLLKV